MRFRVAHARIGCLRYRRNLSDVLDFLRLGTPKTE